MRMKKDNVFLGIAVGIVFPFLIYGLILLLDKYFHINTNMYGNQILRTTTLHLLVLCSDLFMVWLTTKLFLDETNKGVIISVMILALALVIYNYKEFFNY